MGQRCLSTSSCVLEEIFLPSENELGFWKPQAMHYYQDAKVQTPLSRSVVPSSLEKSVNCLEMPISPLARDHKEKYHVGGYERNPSFARALGEYNNNNQKASPNLCMKAVSYSVEINKLNDGGTRYRNSLSSSTLSEVFGRKSGLSKNNGLFHKSVDTVASCHEEEELSGSMEEIEVQTIGNLLPDEDDIFSGVLGELEYIADAKGGDDAEDFDLFSSVGGMELESKDVSHVSEKESDFTGGVPNDRESSKVSLASAHPHAQHPSRTLFVRNIHINVEESELRVLFEQFGDIQTLYTACKHQGFIMISYFDIRASKNAMIALQDKLLGHRKLDIHYSTPKVDPSEKDIRMDTSLVFNTDSSVSNEDLHLIFGIYGEIMEIRDTPCKCHRKFIEYYDVRAAEAARCALNDCNISGEQIKLGPCCPEGERQCLIQKCSEMGQDEAGPYRKSVNVSSSEAVSRGGSTVGCLNNGSVQDIPSVSHVPLNALTKNALRNGNFGVLDSICSQSSLAPTSNHFGFEKPSHFLDQVKFGSKCIPSFFPRSFPECQDTGNIFILQNSSSTAANMVSNIGSGVSDGMTGRNITVVDSSGKLVELKGGVSGPSPNVTSPFRGPLWSNSNSFLHHLSSPMTWQKSPLFGVSPLCPPQLSAFSEMLPDMLNTGSAPNYLHAGSAPITSPSLWDRRHAYTVESPEGSVFCLGSLGSNIPANSPLHTVGRPSHTFSRAGGNCMEKLTNDALHSPHQMCHLHPARNTVTSLPTSFGSPHDCRRNLSHRRNQGSSNYGERKQFELDIDRILQGDDSRTTLMIKNIPNKYTSKLLLTTIDEHCEGTYDFIYLPIDFKNKCNVGYAFINLIDPLQIIPFYKVISGKKWEKFNSEKVAALAYARIQGKAALVAHFQNSSLMNEDKHCRPILICTDGPNAGEQEPFPVGANIRSKSGRARSSVNEDHHHHHHHHQGSSIYVN